MSKTIAFLSFGFAAVLIGIGVRDMTKPWSAASLKNICAWFEIPAEMSATQVHELSLVIRNENRTAIEIVGEYTC